VPYDAEELAMIETLKTNLFSGNSIRPTFSGHDTFPFRYTWLKKAVDAVSQDPDIFSREDALVELGVGKNMVNSIKHWAGLTDVIMDLKDSKIKNRKFQLSDFGKKLLSDRGWDPFLEDIATLWLLHWKICTQPEKATTWYFAFNRFPHIEFAKEQLLHDLLLYAEANQYNKSTNIIERDIDCFVRTYVPSRHTRSGILEDSLDCPLTELGLIQDFDQKGLYIFSRGPQLELPDPIFAYALTEYWNRLHENKGSLSFEDIAYGEGSPGLVFKLDEDSLAYRLDSLEKLSNGAFRYDETSSLRQVYRSRSIDSQDFLTLYYRGKS